jgi:6-hydroxycyclohex-1-ene-1-carbonyl-CoA dehydrogenase
MRSGDEPLVETQVEVEGPGEGEVLVEVAGCGVCHTDLGFYYDGVRTRYALPLTLGHEISGRVMASGPGSEAWQDAAVIIPAVRLCPAVNATRAGVEWAIFAANN